MLLMRSLISRAPQATRVLIFGLLFALGWQFFFDGGKSYPFSTFLFRPEDRFMDFVHFWEQCKDLNPYLSVAPTATRPYFPFAYLINYLFMFESEKFSFALFFGIWIFVVAVFSYKILEKLQCSAVWIFYFLGFLFSYAFLFTVDRGNPEIMILPLLMAFIYNYLWGSKKIAALLLACAISMKLTPLLFLLLYFKDRRYKEAVHVVLLSLIFTSGSFWLFSWINPRTTMSDHFQRMLLNQSLYTKTYSLSIEGLIFSHSLFGVLKYFTIPELGHHSVLDLKNWMKLYTLSIFIFTGILSLIIYRKRPSTEITVGIIICLMLLGPHVSADYRLINLFLPLLFVIENKKRLFLKSALGVFLALSLIPKSYFHHGTFPEISSSVILTPVCLLICLGLLIYGIFGEQTDVMDKSAVSS